MSNQNQEILAIIIVGGLLSLLLVGFIVSVLFLYKKRQQQHSVEMATMQEEYDQQILRVQFEMQEATLAEISFKLHDAIKNNVHGIAGGISSIRLKIEKKIITEKELLSVLERYEKDLMIVREEIRLTSHSLSQDKLDNIGLIEAIEFEGNRITRNNSYNKIFATINKQAVYNFTQEQSVYLFRIFQEIMGNILNHSKATLVSITIDLITNNTFYLCVEDNGIGFNISEKQKSKLSGIGLSGMKKRALQIGASFKLESTLQKGTTITIELPLPLLPNTATKKNEKSTYSFD